MDWTKPFLVKNISKGKIVAGPISIPHLGEREINPLRYTSKVIDSLKAYYALDKMEATNNFDLASSSEKSNEVKEVLSTKNEHGDTHSHVVYNPSRAKAIETEEISLEKKSIEVNNLLNDGKIIEVEFSDIDKIEAKEFIDQHWKRFESEVNKITNKRKLNFYLAVAKEWEVASKKIEILENRISEL